jgi:hypothetical protein
MLGHALAWQSLLREMMTHISSLDVVTLIIPNSPKSACQRHFAISKQAQVKQAHSEHQPRSELQVDLRVRWRTASLLQAI